MQRAKPAVLCILLASYAVAQTPSESPILVKVMGTSLDKGTQETFELNVTNVSATNIKAFVLRLELLDSTGKVKSVTNQMELEAGARPAGNQVLSPGESMAIEWKIPVLGRHPNYNLTADYVALVRDSSTSSSTISTLEDWGLDKSEMSERVKGLLVGLHDERTRLRQLTDSQGVTALSNDLDSEGAKPEVSQRRSEEYRIGLLNGYKFERQRLQRLLHQQGTSSVIADLEQDQ